MIEQEGVIKFNVSFKPAEPELDHDYSDLNDWRQIFKQAEILGQDVNRYDGLGFGNLSERLSDQSFLISGTQTGMLNRLEPAHYSRVLNVDLATNSVRAQGSVKPSSESLTHAAIYQLDADIRFVFHVHSPDIWRNREVLQLPETAADVPYGTMEMAQAIKALSDAGAFRQLGVLAMAGHEDGIISFAEAAQPAGQILIDTLSLARQL
ncbi:MAG: L-ribulose-5-phosphate 4-epimerase [Gammaproteobacteria bacterium]|jgi:L-ribulose-5-phosphate 4-epimerase